MLETWKIVLLAVGFAVVILGLLFLMWPKSGKLGINTRTVHCPRCGTKAPLVRKPANLRQALWGGWTCADSRCEFDKYGSEVDS